MCFWAVAVAISGEQARRAASRSVPNGCFKWKGVLVGLSQAFAGLDVALRPTAHEGLLSLHFMRFELAKLDTKTVSVVSKTVRDVPVHPSTISPV